VLGGLGKGFANLMNELPRERLILAIGALAACEGTIARTIAYVKERTRVRSAHRGVPEHALQARRARGAGAREQGLHRGLQGPKYDRGELTAVDASVAKLTTTELQGKVADECLQLFGGYGYMTEYPVSRDFVDARIQRIYGGTSEIMKEIIARSTSSVAEPAIAEQRALLFVALGVAQLLEHPGVLERGHVAHLGVAGGQARQQAPHDLAAARLGQRVGEAHRRRAARTPMSSPRASRARRAAPRWRD
jgi:hypothetical protein